MNSKVLKVNEHLCAKFECELDYGSYKIRGVKNYFAKRDSFSDVHVLSAGNLASACVGEARKKGVKCTAVVPEFISRIKENKIISLGGDILKIPFLDLWAMVEDQDLVLDKDILHPIHPDLLEGYGEIVDEIISEYVDCKNVFVPFGLGGLALGLVRARKRLNANFNIFLVEVENFTPFKHYFENNKNELNEYMKSFIEAMGAPRVLEFVFEELKSQIKGVVTVKESDVSDCIRSFFIQNKVKLEGAAGAALAGAKKLKLKKSLALLTGENISTDVFEEIINGSHC